MRHKKLVLSFGALAFALFLATSPVRAIYTLPGLSEEEILNYCAKRNDSTTAMICDLYQKISFVSNRAFNTEQRVDELSTSLERRQVEINSLQQQVNDLKARVTELEKKQFIPVYQVPPPQPGIYPLPLPINPPQPQILPIPQLINP